MIKSNFSRRGCNVTITTDGKVCDINVKRPDSILTDGEVECGTDETIRVELFHECQPVISFGEEDTKRVSNALNDLLNRYGDPEGPVVGLMKIDEDFKSCCEGCDTSSKKKKKSKKDKKYDFYDDVPVKGYKGKKKHKKKSKNVMDGVL